MSIIIIGAGLAGLAAGCYAQMNGYPCHIFERRTQAGGVAAWWKRGGYTIDGGIHFIMGQKPGNALYRLSTEVGINPAGQFIELSTYGRFIDEDSGRTIEITSDLGRLREELKRMSPPDSAIIEDLISGARAMQGNHTSEIDIGAAPELASPLDKLKVIWQMRRVMKYFSGKYTGPVSAYVSNISQPWLRRCIENLFLPEVPVWFILIILGLLADGQLGLLKGGCQDFVGAMEKHYRQLGGEITYQATVKDILVENDRAAGVRLADGGEHRAVDIVSCADGYSTIFEMLGGRYTDKDIKERYSRWQPVRPMVIVSYGIALEFPREPAFNTIVLKQPVSLGNSPVNGLFIRIFNYGNSFAPPGKTVLQVIFETEWDHWYGLQKKDRAAYEAEKKRVAAEVLTRLERYYPGISTKVEVTDVATPYTTWRYTLNYKGAWGGWLLTPEIATRSLPRTLPGLSHFYMAGQWVMPGGGVPACLYSGRQAIQIICRRNGKKFRLSPE